ncbi:type I restriction-modification system subunit M [Chitinophaga flava]|uniref:site-specific DNA-methyltransferase (adenine-specific) n=1 Tax=Chitinophaga flava TaxID=2259036 RepID=A0A365XS37_9BACT|nr:class I SAM-dependent DNA methyltransferase [Chitinophaga flava]RBL89143.1 type I restriction endonuclease subunit M [Chitinophaga flava]
MAEKLDLSTLESWLWDSANILRGSIDSSDFKNYIFGLLFLKRVNDVFEEEVESIMKTEKVSRAQAESDTFFKLPDVARWEYLKSITENVGIALDKAFAAIEESNAKLRIDGVLTATKFGDKEKLSDPTLMRLLRHFNEHSLRNEDLYTPDLLGDAYEYLIKQFADDAGKKGGEFYTPRGVVKLLVQLVKPQPGNKVYDPTCGSGGMLIEAARYIAEQPGGLVGKNINVSLFGQEKNLGTWAIAKLNMLLHNYVEANLEKGDTLIEPKHQQNGELMLFDRVIANPPFSQDKWWTIAEANIPKKVGKDGKEKEVALNYNKVVVDKYGRFQYGIPPRGYADLAFLQHMLSVLKQDGKMAVVLPHGTLFRGGTEGEIRRKLIEGDLIEGIIGLPSALFYNTGIPASVWILSKCKPHEFAKKVIVIDASGDFEEGKNQNELGDRQIERIVNSYSSSCDIDKYMRIIPVAELNENNYNVNISRYFDSSEKVEEFDLFQIQMELKAIAEREVKIDAKLSSLLEKLGI